MEKRRSPATRSHLFALHIASFCDVMCGKQKPPRDPATKTPPPAFKFAPLF
jgi:hypothetical protein